MARYTFTPMPEPGVYNITRGEARAALDTEVGTLTKRKRNWDLVWEGTRSTHPHRLSVVTHLRALGHAVNGL